MSGIIEDDGVDVVNNVTRFINQDTYRVTIKTPIYETSIRVKNGESLAEDVILSEGTNSMIVIEEDPARNISISKINLTFNPPIFPGAPFLDPPPPGHVNSQAGTMVVICLQVILPSIFTIVVMAWIVLPAKVLVWSRSQLQDDQATLHSHIFRQVIRI